MDTSRKYNVVLSDHVLLSNESIYVQEQCLNEQEIIRKWQDLKSKVSNSIALEVK